MSKQNWASQPLNEKSDQVFLSMGGLLPISLISKYSPLTCDIDDSLKVILEKEQFKNFDHVPVCSDRIIVGLLNTKNVDPSKTVREVMQNLNQSILISSDASILSFIEKADNHPCRLVIEGTEIKGIVTISDLQKLAVRPVLFSLITYLELLMAEFIRKDFINEDWSKKLSPCRQKFVKEKWEKLNQNNMAIDSLSATEFCDKRTLVMKSKIFTEKLSDVALSKVKTTDIFKEIENLRNSLAHAGDYALTEENARGVSQTVRNMQQFIKILRSSI